MCKYKYKYMNLFIIYTHTHTHIYIYTCKCHVCMYVCIYIYISTYFIYIYIYTQAHMYRVSAGKQVMRTACADNSPRQNEMQLVLSLTEPEPKLSPALDYPSMHSNVYKRPPARRGRISALRQCRRQTACWHHDAGLLCR